MGYIMERAALVDKMFYSVQLAFRRVPASLAVTTLLVCAFWGIARGIVGAVVVLMGVIALRPMLNAGYDVRLASGAITAGGTLGILIPPSVMLIVYAAVAGQSIVKLYAAAMLPGFFLTLLYLVYILGWAMINPKIAPSAAAGPVPGAVPDWIRSLERGPSRRVIGGLIAAALRPAVDRGAPGPDGRPVTYRRSSTTLLVALVPLVLTVAHCSAATWWYVVIYNAPASRRSATAQPEPRQAPRPDDRRAPRGRAGEGREGGRDAPGARDRRAESADRRGREDGASRRTAGADGVAAGRAEGDGGAGKMPAQFYAWFWSLAAVSVCSSPSTTGAWTASSSRS